MTVKTALAILAAGTMATGNVNALANEVSEIEIETSQYYFGKIDVSYADFYYGEINKVEPE